MSDIDIDPAGVLRSADSVTAAARQVGQGGVPGHPGNDGFTMSGAIARFAQQMHATTSDGSRAMTSTAARLEGSARLMRTVDDDVQDAQRALWSRIR